MKSSTMRITPCIAHAANCLWQKRKFLVFVFFICFSWSTAFSQEGPVTLTGVVKDSSGSPMPNVTVMEKGKSNAAVITDVSGVFSIKP